MKEAEDLLASAFPVIILLGAEELVGGTVLRAGSFIVEVWTGERVCGLAGAGVEITAVLVLAEGVGKTVCDSGLNGDIGGAAVLETGRVADEVCSPSKAPAFETGAA
jgi:hypothetical protein